MHAPRPPARAVPILLPALLAACGPAESPGLDAVSGWAPRLPPDAPPMALEVSPDGTLRLPTEGPAPRLCHPLPLRARERAELTVRWGVQPGPSAPSTGVGTLEVAWLGADGAPLREAGGLQRIVTNRGKQAARPDQQAHALLSAPAAAEGAELCLVLRGLPGAAVTLGEPALGRIARDPAPGLPDILVIVVDALRADALGPWGASPSVSPTLDALAPRALLFERAWCQYTWTGPSFVSTMTSRFARSHGWTAAWSDEHAPKPRPGADVPTLPAVLRDAGYITVGINANGYLDWLDATDLGFDQWSYEGDNPAVDAALRELSLWAHDGHPNFLYLHLMATHHPLCPSAEAQRTAGVSLDPSLYGPADNSCPAGGLGQDPSAYADQMDRAEHTALYRDTYRAAVADADRHIARVLAALAQEGRAEGTVVVVTSDHGELLGEHGANGHGPWVWEPLAHVPLLITGPGVTPGHREDVARLIDLAPTLLALAGLEGRQPESWQGRSLLGVDTPALAVSERQGLVATTLDGRYKRIVLEGQPGPPLRFDLHRDPGEEHPLGDGTAPFAALDEASDTWEGSTPVVIRSPDEQSLDPDAARDLHQRLRALGYLDASGSQRSW